GNRRTLRECVRTGQSGRRIGRQHFSFRRLECAFPQRGAGASRRFGEAAMLIPSIDLLGGRIVQLVQGEKLRLAFDDFEYWIEKFARFPLVQLIDLDAAMRQGDNAALVEQICKRLPCQVGGGVRNAERGKQLLDAGARRVIVGSALFAEEGGVNAALAAEMAEKLGVKHVVAGIDTKN